MSGRGHKNYVVLWEKRDTRATARRTYAYIPAENPERAVEAAVTGYQLQPAVDGLSIYVVEAECLRKFGTEIQVKASAL